MIKKIFFTFLSLLTLSSCSLVKKSPRLQESINKNIYNVQDSPYPKDAVEVKIPVALKVEGNIPSWLKGKLFQNSPGKYNIGNEQLTHWFDGFAFVSAFEFKNDKIYYQGAYPQSDQYLESMDSGSIKLRGFAKNFGEGQEKHISHDRQKVKTANANVNIEKVGNHLIALGETPLPIELDPVSLATIGVFDYKDRLNKARMWESAHMKRDPETGSLYNFYTHYKMRSAYVIYKIEEGSAARVPLVKHHIAEPSYMHDFSITKNYIILTAYPLVVNPMDLLGLFDKNSKLSFIGAHRWEPDRGTKIYVFDKKTGKLAKELKADAKFAFHHINAFEDKDGLINLYLNAFDNSDILLRAGDQEYKSSLRLEKILIDLKNSSVDVKVISKNMYEMPRVKEDLIGLENKYFYSIWYNMNGVKDRFGLVKYDIETNSVKSWTKEGLVPGEPIFITNPNSKTEDDGVILSVVYDKLNKRSFLLVLDALTMKELARAYTPYALPIGLHAKFI